MSSFSLLATGNLVLGGLVFLLGLVILRENPRQKLNLVVAFMLFFGGLGSILTALSFAAARAGAGPGAVSAGMSENFAYLWEFFFPTLFIFASIFPRERPFTRRFRSFPVVVYSPHAVHFLLLLGLSLVGNRVALPGLDVPAVARPLVSLLELFLQLFLAVHRALFSLVNLGFGVAGALLLLHSFREARLPRLKRQLGVIGIGLTVCLLLYSLASSLPVLLSFRVPEWLRSLLIVCALTVGSGAIAYSMVRYKFLDTKLLARRGILYALASAVLVGFYLIVVVRVNRLLAAVSGVDTRILEPVLLVMALILFQPAISRLEEGLERFFLRDRTDYRNVLKRLGKDLLTALDLDEMLSNSIRTIAETLMLRSAHVAVLAREGPVVHVGAGDPVPPDELGRLADILHGLPPDRESLRTDEEEIPAAADLMRMYGASVVFPLRSKGETVGALLLGDKVTGTEYTSEDLALLSSLAAQMSVSVQNGLLLRDRVAVARFEEELSLARHIQSTFLPSTFPAMDELDVHAVNSPSREVGGDFYDLVPAGDGIFYLAIADVSGKGVPAALLTSMLQASLRTQAGSIESVSAIMANINALVVGSTTAEQFATFFLARVDEGTLRVVFSNGGHLYPVLCRKTGERIFLEKGGMILGMFDGIDFEEGTVDLRPGDRIVLYTDGISEAENRAGEDFGEERLWDLVQALPGDLSARAMTERLLDELDRFLDGGEPQDDVTLMVVRVLEPRTSPLAGSGEKVGTG